MEEAQCYDLMVLNKICVKVKLKYPDGIEPQEAESVSNVKASDGCFIDGNPGQYRKQPIEPLNYGEKTHVIFNLAPIPVEIRSENDPYNIFSSLDPNESTDMSIFFWLSMLCLLGSFLMIVLLGVHY